ncbi:MAG: hypothetical protein QNI94_16905 [Kiloniellales bacterium]|nr:hypothetical protein [Kiloniellales bacterium]
MLRFPGLKAILLLAATSLTLVGCELTPERNVYPELTYQHLDPIRLDVRDIVVEQAYAPPLSNPNVDHDFPVKPMDVAARWAQDRLVAAGATRTATFVIRDAAVVEVPLEQSEGVTGAFTTDQSERYDAHLEVQIVIRDDRGWEEANLITEVTRTMTVAEDVTLNEREKAWYSLTEKLMVDMDQRLAESIEENFQRYRVR